MTLLLLLAIATKTPNAGISTYNNAVTTNNWVYVAEAGSGNLDSGSGYSIKPKAPANVPFTGTLNTADVSVAITVGAGTPFNLIGNPYTSYINSGTFLTANTGALTSETIWLWNPTTKNYDAKITADTFKLDPGQGFFVSCGSAGNVTFAEVNQSHKTDTFLKSSPNRTEVNLLISDGASNRYAKLYYLDNATKGFDNGYDGETFSGVANTFDVFTQLISNNVGKNYQIQSLPNSDLESMVIPVGIKAASGKEITFTADALNLPSDINVFLEDKLANTFTRLDEANTNYKVTLTENLDGVGRFYLHTTTQSALSVDTPIALDNISIYKADNSTLRIIGLQQENAKIKLYNVLGKQVMNSSFESNGVKDISLPRLATGVYIVQLETEAGSLNKKIILE